MMGASGGDMAMAADVSRDLSLDFAPLPAHLTGSLREVMTDRVTLANPFDIHTYLWFDPPGLQRVFALTLNAGYDAAGFMLDSPPEDQADCAAYDAVIDAFINAAQGARTRAALIASLPETISARIRTRCLDGGVVPLQGQREALEALALAAGVGASWRNQAPVQLQLPAGTPDAGGVYTLGEHDGKAALAAFGVQVPRGRLVSPAAAAEAAVELGFPVVIKATGAHLEHKTEVGGVVLNVRSAADAHAAAERLAKLSDMLQVEEMLTDGVAEVLIGVIVDPQFGQVLVLGAGGVLTELLSDSVSLLPPWTAASVGSALRRLKIARLLDGYRGKPAADVAALIDGIVGVARYARNSPALVEIDVNPMIVRPLGYGAVAVDTLIRLKKTS
jgi:acetyl-CoA synthetase